MEPDLRPENRAASAGFLHPARVGYDDRGIRSAPMAERFTLTVNGAAHTVEVDDPSMPLLYALRDELKLSNPRFGFRKPELP